LQPSGIEIFDPANVPQQFVELLLKLKVPYDIFIADAGLLGPHDAQPFAVTALGFPASDGRQAPSAKTGAREKETDWVKYWRKIAEGARQIIAPCAHAEAFAAGILPGRPIKMIACPAEKPAQNLRKVQKSDSTHLAFVPIRSCAHEQWLMSAIARKFIGLRPDLTFTVLGTSLDDMGLMHSGNVFVTGPVNVEELPNLLTALSASHLFVCTTRPLFGHPILNAAHSSSLPTAYFDWSKGRIKPKKRDLAIDPNASLDDIIDALSRWMPTP
jgi:hypothetical protein